MLSSFSRWLTDLCALFYGLLGAFCFLLPFQVAPVFAWKVTPFITMTIGGWCLGNAWLAYITARRWHWRLVYTSLIYLWLFGIGELLVVLQFRSRLQMGHPVAWLYVVTLLINVLAAALGLSDWWRIHPSSRWTGTPVGPGHRLAALAFVISVGFLGIYGMTAQAGAPGTNGGIFPEALSLFTLRSFGVFYFCLAIAAIPLIWDRNLNTLLHHSYASYGLILAITAAALVNLRLFDFTGRPGGLLYFAAFFVVGIPLFFMLRNLGTGLRA
jgi:hypothetical protein